MVVLLIVKGFNWLEIYIVEYMINVVLILNKNFFVFCWCLDW